VATIKALEFDRDAFEAYQSRISALPRAYNEAQESEQD